MDFEWDEAKARTNVRRHRVTFREAISVFADSVARIYDDPDHSLVEHREIIVGYSEKHRLLVVSYTEREERIRIISARRATRLERENHEEKR